MEIPSSIYIAIGAVLAALVAGFFSFLNLISSKENKVSEFRQAWINGLRQEIAVLVASLQELIRIRACYELSDTNEVNSAFIENSLITYRSVIETITKIHLRLNPAHAEENLDSHEARLLSAIQEATDQLNEENFSAAKVASIKIRDAAAPFLKSEWERVKNGESRYQIIRDNALRTIKLGILLLALFVCVALITSLI